MNQIKQLKYRKLATQEYLVEGNENTESSKFIFKARGRNLDIKKHKKWKYEDSYCVGFKTRIENEQDLIDCPELKVENNEQEKYCTAKCLETMYVRW